MKTDWVKIKEILDRVKLVIGSNTQQDIAREFGVAEQTVST
jgi:DNA-binding CsgD family transcriptional regulator